MRLDEVIRLKPGSSLVEVVEGDGKGVIGLVKGVDPGIGFVEIEPVFHRIDPAEAVRIRRGASEIAHFQLPLPENHK